MDNYGIRIFGVTYYSVHSMHMMCFRVPNVGLAVGDRMNKMEEVLPGQSTQGVQANN